MNIYLPTIHITVERWKYNKSVDAFISTEGRIKDLDGNIMRVCAQDKYIVYKGKRVHRLVMETFKPVEGYETLTVDHLNHNTRDNRLCNLEWVTFEENKKRAQIDIDINSQVNNLTVIKPNRKVLLNGKKMILRDAMEVLQETNNFKAAIMSKDKNIFFKKYVKSLAELSLDEPVVKKIAGNVITNWVQ